MQQNEITKPQAAAEVEGTPEERRDSIFAGMDYALEEVISTSPHIRYALSIETPEIRAANGQLSTAVNDFISGRLLLRSEVRPYFNRSIEAYLKAADQVVLIMRAILVFALKVALIEHPYMDISAETEFIREASESFYRERRLMLIGDCRPEELHRAFYLLVAAYAEAATPRDLPDEPLNMAA